MVLRYRKTNRVFLFTSFDCSGLSLNSNKLWLLINQRNSSTKRAIAETQKRLSEKELFARGPQNSINELKNANIHRNDYARPVLHSYFSLRVPGVLAFIRSTFGIESHTWALGPLCFRLERDRAKLLFHPASTKRRK